ncbi:MAG TPA: single-stranded-DNA-specific exonuclease RecJ, partial [Pantoea sp.]|nr:single-stranded-DNA-specific exonuclease RecJ [Pantoea sp.]
WIGGVDLRGALERLGTLNPGLILKCGVVWCAFFFFLYCSFFFRFRHSFAELVGEWLDGVSLQGIIWSDGALQPQEFSLQTAEMLREAGPWGQAFPEPAFDGKFKLLQQRLVGERHLKVMVEPLGGGPLIDGIAFNVDTTLWPDTSVRQVELAYKLDINEYRGNRSVQLIIDHLWPIN